MLRVMMLALCVGLLAGCATGYTLVQPGTVTVANGTMQVQPSIAWNKVPRMEFDTSQKEHWTQNGPILDLLTFIGGVLDGEAIAAQSSKDEQKVPVFRSNMTPQDLVSMIESYYRIKGGATIFETTSVSPARFLGQQAIELNFNYMRVDEVKRRGRALLAVADGRLYFMSLDAAALHYFDAAAQEFATIAASAART